MPDTKQFWINLTERLISALLFTCFNHSRDLRKRTKNLWDNNKFGWVFAQMRAYSVALNSGLATELNQTRRTCLWVSVSAPAADVIHSFLTVLVGRCYRIISMLWSQTAFLLHMKKKYTLLITLSGKLYNRKKKSVLTMAVERLLRIISSQE